MDPFSSFFHRGEPNTAPGTPTPGTEPTSPASDTAQGSAGTPKGRTDRKEGFPPSPKASNNKDTPRSRGERTESFNHATSPTNGSGKANSASSAKATPITEAARKKKLIANNAEMQNVLQGLLNEMLTGNRLEEKSEKHVAVLAHLHKQLMPLSSGVPGVHLTGFSHVRYFDTVMPHDFAPTTTEDLQIQIIADSLAYAEHPTSPIPSNVFTLDQFQNNKEPIKDPEILPPEHAVQGRDCRGNHIVGLHAGHAGMTALNEQYQTSQKTSISLEKNKDSWRDTAWMAALMNLSPNDLKNDLEDEKKGVPEDRKEHIVAIQTAARVLQTARLQAAELKKNGERYKANEHLKEASNDAFEAIRKHGRPLTRAVLDSKSRRGGYLMDNKSVRDQARMMALMSALGVPVITMQGRNADGGPASMTYHAADMTHAEEAFSSAEGHKKKEFLAKEMQSVPVVEIGENGFTLTFPEAAHEPEHVKPDDDISKPKAEPDKQAPPAAKELENTDDEPAACNRL